MATVLEPIEFERPVRLLRRDLRRLTGALDAGDARWLVDEFYAIQEVRKATNLQESASESAGEPIQLKAWIVEMLRAVERTIAAAMGEFAAGFRVGRWLQAQYGIGPILSAGLLVGFDIRRAPTVGHFWSFAGLNPEAVWAKGQKRPWNARLKSLCLFRLGETLVKFSGKDECFYGRLYAAKKAEIAAANEAGGYTAYAGRRLEEKNFGKATAARAALEKGRLPDGQVHNRARRWAIKLFLAHLHEIEHWDFYGTPPPRPYVMEHRDLGDHRHLLRPPLFEPGSWIKDFPGKPLKELLGD
jgi:hypothetical protein